MGGIEKESVEVTEESEERRRKRRIEKGREGFKVESEGGSGGESLQNWERKV